MLQLPGLEGKQEVRLVLAPVKTPAQTERPPVALDAGVVAGRQGLGSHPERGLQQLAELDAGVAVRTG